jgi:lipopolysaccharide export system protein LptA
MNLLLRASILLPLSLGSALAYAKSTDRNQPVAIDAGHQVGNFEENGRTVMSQGIVITQGTLEIQASAGEMTMKNGDPARAVFTGSPVTLKQQMDDGSPMVATANRLDYDLINDVITLTGNYTVKSPKGSNSGQKMVYNLKSGNMESGGDGSRVKTVIQPKSAGAPKKPEATK